MNFDVILLFITIRIIIINKMEEITSGEWLKMSTEYKILWVKRVDILLCICCDS